MKYRRVNMKKTLLSSISLLVMLTGCNTIEVKKDSAIKEEAVKGVEPLKAEIQVSNQAKTAEKTELVVLVSQNDQPIDAREVVFEIVKKEIALSK
jgi:hypothetical protein